MNLQQAKLVEVMSMVQINLSEEDANHIKDWQRLTAEEKDALNKLAKVLGDSEKRKSLYSLLETQAKISDLLAISGHLNWAGRMFLKAGAIAGVLIAVATFYKVYLGGKM